MTGDHYGGRVVTRLLPPPGPPSTGSYWHEAASRWGHVAPPLRPSEPDIASFLRAARSVDCRRAMILGVTPELYSLPWPDGAEVMAIDHTPQMIETVWPGPANRTLCGDWARMPLAPSSLDAVLCDGGLHLLPYPDGQKALVEGLRRVLTPGAIFAVRLFTPPAKAESAGTVLDDLWAGRIGDLNSLKLRLWAALQTSPPVGVAVADVWRAVRRSEPDTAALARRIGWDPGHLAALDAYRHSPDRYHLVTVAEAVELFCSDPGGFDVVSVDVPDYELGERCPTVVFERRGPSPG